MKDKDKAKRRYDDYDSPWKEVIEQYFQDFIAFFFPLAYNDIDWSKDHKFMDKELRQITRDAKTGRKYVDKLVHVSTWPKVFGYFTDHSRRVCNPPHTVAGLQTRRERCWKTYGQVLTS